MRLADIAAAVAQHGARRYLEKHAGIGVALPMGIGYGLSLPSQVKGMGKTYRNSRQGLDQAALEQLDPAVATHFKHAGWTDFMQGATGMVGKPDNFSGGGSSGQMAGNIMGPMMAAGGLPVIEAPGKALGTRIERRLSGREFGEKKDPLRMLGQSTIMSLGKGIGLSGAELLKDMASKAVAAAGNAGNASARKAILDQLRREDLIIQEADDKMLMEAYHTMERFAPVLSTDKNAVRSFLRQAVMSGVGPDYMTIKLLADSERAITGKDDKR